MSCKNCNANCVEAGTDHEMCMAWTKKPMTNADYIRSMGDAELAGWIKSIQHHAANRAWKGQFISPEKPWTTEQWLDWLKGETEE